MSYEQPPQDPHQPYQVPAVPSAPPASPAPYGQYPQYVVAVSPPVSTWSVVSLIFGIIGVLGGFCLLGIPCIVAVITGHAGLIDSKNGKGGRGLAIAGLVMGYLFIVPAVIVLVTGGIGNLFQ